MKKELNNQYAHYWRTFRKVCTDFNEQSWTQLGYGITQPGRLAIHILQSSIFYIEGKEPLVFKDGSLLEMHSSEIPNEQLPDLENILYMTDVVEKKTEKWIHEMDMEQKNDTYPWTGETAFSVVIFLLKHSQYHLGEMNALLNEQLQGKAEDHFAKVL